MLGLHFCVRAFSSCSKRGPLFIAVHRPLTVAASLVVEHRLQTRRLSSCGSRAQLFRGMWDLPRPGLESVSPALAGGFSTTAPPGKPTLWFWFAFLWYLAMMSILHVPVSHLYVFFGKLSIQVFCPFFNWGVWVFWAIYIFWILTPCQSHHLQILSPIP